MDLAFTLVEVSCFVWMLGGLDSGCGLDLLGHIEDVLFNVCLIEQSLGFQECAFQEIGFRPLINRFFRAKQWQFHVVPDQVRAFRYLNQRSIFIPISQLPNKSSLNLFLPLGSLVMGILIHAIVGFDRFIRAHQCVLVDEQVRRQIAFMLNYWLLG